MSHLELFDDVPGSYDSYEDGLCGCGDDVTAVMEIDAGDLLISCSTCGKSLLPIDDQAAVYSEPIPVELECIQEHDHHWDTVGCDCNYYWELKTRVPTE
jgi:hypothetical protein